MSNANGSLWPFMFSCIHRLKSPSPRGHSIPRIGFSANELRKQTHIRPLKDFA
jgi:hypothetical protein